MKSPTRPSGLRNWSPLTASFTSWRVWLPTESVPKVDLDNSYLGEREWVIVALEDAGWVQTKAARLLNMTPRQIADRIQTLNIRVRQF